MAFRLPSLPSYLQANNPNNFYDLGALNREVANTAAARGVGMGMPGSPFARNLETALRFSEQQKFLQPYLEREMQAQQMAQQAALEQARIGAQERIAQSGQAAEMARLQASLEGQRGLAELEQRGALERQASQLAGQTALQQLSQGGDMARLREQIAGQQQNVQTQLAADAARQAIEQAGLDRRLTQQQQSALALATLQGNQQMQDTILREAGVTSRQATELAARLNETMLTLQERRFESLIPLLAREREQRSARITPPWTGPRTIPAGVSQVIGAPAGPSRPATAPTGFSMSPVSGSNTSTRMNDVDRILLMYGLGPGTSSGDPYANWSAATGMGFGPAASGPNVVSNVPGYVPQNDFEWTQTTSPAMQAMQAYYE